MLTLARLREANATRSIVDWKHEFGDWSTAEWCNALAGEVGEACNIAKKILRLDKNIRTELAGKSREEYVQDLAQELADTLLYVDLVATKENIDLEASVIRTFNNKSDVIGSKIKLGDN